MKKVSSDEVSKIVSLQSMIFCIIADIVYGFQNIFKGKETEKRERYSILVRNYGKHNLYWDYLGTRYTVVVLRNEKVNLTFPFEDSKQP